MSGWTKVTKEPQMPKEKEPTPSLEPVPAGDAQHAEPTMSIAQVMDLLKATVAANALTPDKMAEIVSAVASSVAKAANPIWWDERLYHEKSIFSYPEGNFARAKPKLARQIFWVGYKVDEDELRPVEIEALNAIRPGTYHQGQWHVTALDNLPEPKSLLVTFPCKDADRRSELPSMLAMCRQMVPGYVDVADEVLA